MESGLSGAFAGTLQGRINVVFPGAVNFPWFQQWNAFVSESAGACQHNFDSFPATAHSTWGSDVVRPLHSAMRQRARTVVRSRSEPIAHHLSPIAKKLRLVKIATVSAAVWGEAERTGELLE